MNILDTYISDEDILRLVKEVINSFHSNRPNIGLPLGNLTSQLLVNVYMNEFDRFVKHKLKAKHYIRYADDFVLLSEKKERLEDQIEPIRAFLTDQLKLTAHKVHLKTVASGVDFLGWVHFPDHRVLRTTTKKRILRRTAECLTPATLSSYCGLLSHGNGYKLQKCIFKSVSNL